MGPGLILKLLKTDGGLGYLPVDWRTLEKTELSCGKIFFCDVPPGRYVHLGLRNGILLSLLKIDVANLPDDIEIITSADGITVSKMQWKPVLAYFGQKMWCRWRICIRNQDLSWVKKNQTI